MQVTVNVAPAPLADPEGRTRTKGSHYKLTAHVHGKAVHFGRRGSDPNNDFLHHQDAHRMLRYLVRHGLDVPEHEQARLEHKDASQLELAAARLKESTKEDWSDPTTPGFWSRWLLWSRSGTAAAIAEVKNHLPGTRLRLTLAALKALRGPRE